MANTDIGKVEWTNADLKKQLKPFLDVYKNRPLANNAGGMLSPHNFYVWFLLKRLRPESVIESGVWKGQSTWLIEQAVPRARIYSIDPVLERIEYRSKNAEYFSEDFTRLDWSGLDREKTVVFIDDHQNAFERLVFCSWFGFRHVIFEDNYPAAQGNCYSLKKAFAGAGLRVPEPRRKRRRWFKPPPPADFRPDAVAANAHDAYFLRKNIDTYYEFPPVFKPDRTRWGDCWSDERYPTKPPLYRELKDAALALFNADAASYTWLCYVRLRQRR